MPHAVSHLVSLPEELVNAILTYLLPDDLVACQLSCKSLEAVASQSLVWRRLCILEYQYWAKKHYFNALLTAPPLSVNFKKLLSDRKRQDNVVSQELSHILGFQTSRVDRAQAILRLGYDAKDELVKHLETSPNAPDYLSRRYWSSEILGSLERKHGLETWQKLADHEEVPIEQALGVFDLFVVERPPLTLDGITRHMDALAEKFMASDLYENWDSQTLTKKTRGLVSWVLHTERLTGMPEDAAFRDLKNNLISVAVCEAEHPSIPLISTVIFCCIAQRLGINASPCGYPMKVLAVIYHNPGGLEENLDTQPIYADPSTGQTDIEPTKLRSQLSAWGIPAARQPEFLQPASTISLVKRTARNMQESLQLNDKYDAVLSEVDDFALSLHPGTTSWRTMLHPPRGGYCHAWCALLFRNAHDDPAVQMGLADMRIPLTRLAGHIQHDFQQDVGMLQNYMTAHHAKDNTNSAFVQALNDEVVENDASPFIIQRRSDLHPDAASKLRHHVGQVFRHARYGYTAAITGWDSECQASDRWIRQMRIDSLSQGREQPFYHAVVASDESSRYVAAENIKILEGHDSWVGKDMPDGLWRIAGRYFKRWDREAGVFVSNIQDQYPED